jgi:hypothetical protein
LLGATVSKFAVSLFGLVNTLVLALYERTRELGMLRAVGMTRRQARRMIRQESIISDRARAPGVAHQRAQRPAVRVGGAEGRR